MSSFKVMVEDGATTGFSIHGMDYKHATNAMGSLERYKMFEKLECIQYSNAARDALSRLLNQHPVDLLQIELLAVQLISDYFKETNATVAYIGSPVLASTKRGSIVIITEFGELLGVALKSSSDIFTVRRLMAKFNRPKTWAEVGSPMFSVLAESWKLSITAVNKRVATFEDYNPEQPREVAVQVALEGLDMTLWEVSQ